MNVQPEILKLRDHLIRYRAWPEAGDQFLALMPHTSWHSPDPNPTDYQLLPQVAADVMAGTDIGARYPAFFQKLLTHPSLRKRFVAELERTVPPTC